MGKYDLAIEDYNQVLKFEPNNKAAFNEKNKLLDKIKNIEEVNKDADQKKHDFNKSKVLGDGCVRFCDLHVSLNFNVF